MNRLFFAACGVFALSLFGLQATEPLPPAITNFVSAGNQQTLQWTPFPGAKSYSILGSTNLGGAWDLQNGTIEGFQWTGTSTVPAQFYSLKVTPLNSSEMLTAAVFNRLAYGPTPDEMERVLTGVNAIGPDAYIAEQLAPETIAENVESSHTNFAIIQAKFASPTDVIPARTNFASIDDFRAWHLLRAVGAKRQLLEVLLQFFENHFVTQYGKSFDYFDQYYNNNNAETRIAAQFEYLENAKWRTALLNPACTFYDLLKISAESPAMIIYLDTVTSKGNGSNVPNENYARELLELFTVGVDNGYTQSDITVLSRCWTGWTLQIVEPSQATNPFARRATNLLASSIAVNATNINVISNLAGVWAFNFNTNNHNTNSKTLFPDATIPARFGQPYTTTRYGTNQVPGRYTLGMPSRRGTNGILDGYEVIEFLADLPFTQEYMSVKLCRLFVHDNFATGYDFTSETLSEEGQLVKACMQAWESSNPKGQLRPVLATIFQSELFRSHGGSMQKVKTPLEYMVSAVRAFRSSTNGTFSPGSFSANTDGYNLIAPIARAGNMKLFDRPDPDGYPEAGPPWISAGTLNERIRFSQALMMITGQTSYSGTAKGDAGSSTVCYPSHLINAKLAPANRTNAAAVADYLLSLVFPGEGPANLDLYRTAAIDFLNDGRADPTPNTFKFGSNGVLFSLSPSSPYDTRVRGLAALLLSYHRFQEQ